jgi:TRAP-type C4-dicarboxylate transport system permease small subunit
MEYFMRTFKKYINIILAALSTLLLTIMTLLVIYQVFARYILNNPSDFTQELIRYFLIWTGFIGAAYAFVTRQHMSLVYFREKMSPEKQRYLLIFVDGIVLLFALVVMVFGGTQLTISVIGVRSALLGIPRSLVYAMGPISGIFIVVIQIINLWEDVTGKVATVSTEKSAQAPVMPPDSDAIETTSQKVKSERTE